MSALDLDDIKRRMEGSLNSLAEFMGLRGPCVDNHAQPIMVEAYGSKMPMNQVGNISVPEPRLLTVTVWDAAYFFCRKGYSESDLGLNPMAEGTLIRVPLICPKNGARIWSRWQVVMPRRRALRCAMCGVTALKLRASWKRQ